MDLLLNIFLLIVFVAVNCQKNMMESLKENRTHFRIGRLNDIWSRAVKLLEDDKSLLNFYGELALQDLHLIRLKHKGLADEGDEGYEDGHQTHLDRKLLEVLLHYGLKDLHLDEMEQVKYRTQNVNNKRNNNNNNNTNNNNNKIGDSNDVLSDILFEKTLKKLPRLHTLWLKAHGAGFADEDLAALKTKFQIYLQKLAEYDELMVTIDKEEERVRLENEGKSEGDKNSDGGLEKSKGYMEKSKRLKELHKELKRMALLLSGEVKGREKWGGGDHRVAELWTTALKANLSKQHMQEIKQDLGELAKHVDKHDYFFKEAEKLKVIGSGEKEGRLKQVNDKVQHHAKQVKSWYVDLKARLYGKILHTDL